MYSICNVVCGYRFPRQIYNALSEVSFFDIDTNEVSAWTALGIQSFYHGGNDYSPIVCGEVIYRFDECMSIKGQQLIPHLTATPEQMASAKAKMDFTRNALMNINEIFVDLIQKLGEDTEDVGQYSQEEIAKFLEMLPQEPEVILVWSTS